MNSIIEANQTAPDSPLKNQEEIFVPSLRNTSRKVNSNMRTNFINQNEDGTRKNLFENEGKVFVAMIRHGERADNVDYLSQGISVEQISDPPLTPIGQQQATETAQFFQNLVLNQKGKVNVIIESSPFLRCLQTASTTAQLLNIDKINVNFNLSKWLRIKKRKFKIEQCEQPTQNNEHPLQKLLISQKDDFKLHHLKSKYLHGIDLILMNNQTTVWDKFPETIESLEQRVLQTKQEILNRQYSEKTILLLFTHGTLQQKLSKSFTGDDTQQWASYCSITGFVITEQAQKLTYDLYDKHVTNRIVDSLAE